MKLGCEDLPGFAESWIGMGRAQFRSAVAHAIAAVWPVGLSRSCKFSITQYQMVRGELYGPLGPQWTNTVTEFSRWTQENGL